MPCHLRPKPFLRGGNEKMNSSNKQSAVLTKAADQKMAARLQQVGEVLSSLGARVIAPGDEPEWMTSSERTRLPKMQTMSLQELEKLQREVRKTMVELEQRNRKEALAAAQKAAAEHGFSLEEILAPEVKDTSRASRAKPSPKYRNPDN